MRSHPFVLAQDIAEDLGAALALFKSISEDLEAEAEMDIEQLPEALVF
jgi:hypothetical protein